MSPPARGQSVRPGVSLLPDVLERRVRLFVALIPACAAPLSLDDLHGASVSSGRRRLIPAGHLLVPKTSRWGGGRGGEPDFYKPSHGGCRPALEQLTSAKEISRGRSASRGFCTRGS